MIIRPPRSHLLKGFIVSEIEVTDLADPRELQQKQLPNGSWPTLRKPFRRYEGEAER